MQSINGSAAQRWRCIVPLNSSWPAAIHIIAQRVMRSSQLCLMVTCTRAGACLCRSETSSKNHLPSCTTTAIFFAHCGIRPRAAKDVKTAVTPRSAGEASDACHMRSAQIHSRLTRGAGSHDIDCHRCPPPCRRMRNRPVRTPVATGNTTGMAKYLRPRAVLPIASIYRSNYESQRKGGLTGPPLQTPRYYSKSNSCHVLLWSRTEKRATAGRPYRSSDEAPANCLYDSVIYP